MRDKRAEKKLLSFIFAILILFLYNTLETTLAGVYDFFKTFFPVHHDYAFISKWITPITVINHT